MLSFLFRDSIAVAAARYLVEDDGPKRADAIVVLGGDEFGTRIVKGAQLQQAGYAPYVLVSGPPYLLGSESDMEIEFARRQGYPVAVFRSMPNTSDSTRSEAKLIGVYLRNHNVRHIILVTSSYHTHRAARLMRQANPFLEVTVVAAPDPVFKPEDWWKTRRGQKRFTLEWLKTIATSLGE